MLETTTQTESIAGIREVRPIHEERFDTRRHLEQAARQAGERGFADLLIVDADAHHRDFPSLNDFTRYIEDPILRHRAEQSREGNQSLLYRNVTDEHVGGRLVEQVLHSQEQGEPGVHIDLAVARRRLESIGIDYQIILPTTLLENATHPITEIQVGVSWAYSRWLTEEFLPREPRLKTLIYLPFCEPAACLRFIDYFSGAPGVVGFLFTSAHILPMHHNSYMKIYRALEERGMPLAIHSVINARERIFEGMDHFFSKWAVASVLNIMVHMTNVVLNGLPERFPNLKFLWMAGGLAWVPFMMQRLDAGYRMRSSEAAVLQKRPSEYMRDFYYTSHLLESDSPELTAMNMELINAESQLLFSSELPAWDFSLPSTIYDLPFLSEQAKRRILGENARALFRLGD